MRDDMTAGICLKGVSSGYKNRIVLRDITLTLPAGKTVMILGENGSGKTTLLKAMAGLLPYEGSITVDGQEISGLKPVKRAAKIAMLSQMNRAYFSYTVEETVRMGRYRFHRGIFDSSDKDDADRIAEYMRMTEIYDIRDERIGELSGGQLQRVYLAQMFAQEADYVFLDEPTNHLDLKYRVALENELKKHGRSVVAVYHDLLPAFMVADMIVLLKNGRIAWTGEPEGLKGSRILNSVFDMDVISYLERIRYDI